MPLDIPGTVDRNLPGALADLAKTAEAAKAAWNVPGLAVAVVHRDRVVWTRTWGVRKAGGSDPITPETLFQIGSISKSFTATSIARLVDEGRLSFEDRVVDHVPGFQLPDPYPTREARIWDLLAQHSGLTPYGGDTLLAFNPKREDLVKAIPHIRTIASFREEFNYVNNLWIVAANAAENRTGQTWEEIVQRRVFDPLRMRRTNTGLEGLTKDPNHAVPHAPGGVPLPPNDPVAPGVYILGPAGGINSTILDMTNYLRLHLGEGEFEGGRILKRETLERLHTPRTPVVATGGALPSSGDIPVDAAYCQGFVAQYLTPAKLTWHNGGTEGSRSILAFIPEGKVGIVVLSNSGDSQIPEVLMYRFYDQLFGRPEKDYIQQYKSRPAPPTPVRPTNPVAPRALETYAGEYRSPVFGSITIRQDGGQLQASLSGGLGLGFALSPWDGDRFSAKATGTVVPLDIMIRFEFDPEGKVSGLVTEGFGEEVGGGRYNRVNP